MAPLVRPPGPENRGIVGNFPMASADPLGLFTQWARTYGDIFHYRVLHRHVYFLNHPDLVKEALVTNYLNFIKGDVVRNNRRVFGKGLLVNEGASWLQQRRLIQPAFHRERIESYANTMVARTERMVSAWNDGETRDIHQDMMRLTLEIVAKALFDVEIASERDNISIALTTLMDVTSGVRLLTPSILRRVPTPGNLRYERAASRLDDVVFGLIDRRRASPQPDSEDLLATLLSARDDAGAPMPTQQLRDEVMTLLLAGHETTAVALSWTWYLLAQNPDAEEKLWSELRQVLNGRSPRGTDLPNLPYTERVVKEAIRLYPPVWAMVRNSIKDFEARGYRIPAGATVILSQWVMHRDPRFYPEPDRFHPDRWLDHVAAPTPKFAYFPFGAGPRGCIGNSFATMEAALVLATIAQRYHLRLAPDCVAEPAPAITLRPRHGIKVILTRRSTV